LLVTVIGCARLAAAGTVWIDTDVSIGSPIREVDDAYALVLALHSPEIRIAGISTSYGNAPLGHTTHAARELIREFGGPANVSSEQVFAGAASVADIGRPTEASEALARALEKESITYVALGPLTNLATFLRLHPTSARKIQRVIFLGGQAKGTTLAFGPRRSFHIHDANVFKDPAAAEAVVRSTIPLTLVPIATASELSLNDEDLFELERHGGAGNYLARRSKVWLWFWTHFVKTGGGPIFDALAVVAATRPELVSTKRRYAKMDETGNLIVTDRLTSGARRAKFATSFSSTTKSFVMRRLMSRQTKEGRFEIAPVRQLPDKPPLLEAPLTRDD
jgi:pyrimidine-specific ribonucleoside hydrolase